MRYLFVLSLVFGLGVFPTKADYILQPNDIYRNFGWSEKLQMEEAEKCLSAHHNFTFERFSNYTGWTVVMTSTLSKPGMAAASSCLSGIPTSN